MPTLDEILQAAHTMRDQLPAIAEETIEDTADHLLTLNKAQMYEGKDSAGGNIGIYKSPYYARKKHQLNNRPGYGYKDHYLTGDYYRGMYVRANGQSIEMGSTDEKAKYLEKKDNLYGLADDRKAEYIEESITPVFCEKMQALTGFIFKK